MDKGMLLRDAAVKLEKSDIRLALPLMKMALEYRPNGPFIIKKIEEYKSAIIQEESQLKSIREDVSNGAIAIVPIGFRCFTKMSLANNFSIKQPSLPFDSGFFPPESVANIIRNGKIRLVHSEDKSNYSVCLKSENCKDCDNRTYIDFETSSYPYINQKISESDNNKELNKYLDSTYGHYTLDRKNKFVLAHYNWHTLASGNRNDISTSPKINIPKINDIINKRIDRMFALCDSAEKILFVFYNDEKTEYMSIDGVDYYLNNFKELHSVLNSMYGSKAYIEQASDTDSLRKLLLKHSNQ